MITKAMPAKDADRLVVGEIQACKAVMTQLADGTWYWAAPCGARGRMSDRYKRKNVKPAAERVNELCPDCFPAVLVLGPLPEMAVPA